MIKAAGNYRPARDLCVITSYYNPAGYVTRRRHYDRFIESLRISGIRCVTIECVFGDAAPSLTQSEDVHSVRSQSVMWQKERLLNLALKRVPSEFTKIAWIDCDVLFANADWALTTSQLLEKCAVVQPFKWAVRLPQGDRMYGGRGEWFKSFAAVHKKKPKSHLEGNFHSHGHTGFAWAARREWLEVHGLYDACIAGSGDHMMAHAFCGDTSGKCIDRIFGDYTARKNHFCEWANQVSRDVDGRLGYAPGVLLHLWHGDTANRQYAQRNRELAEVGFDPRQHLRLAPSGCWEWSLHGAALKGWALNYFQQRREDGERVFLP